MKLGDFRVSPCGWVFTWKVEVGQAHVSTSSAEVIQELEDAFYVEKKESFAPQKMHNSSGKSKRFKTVSEEEPIDLQEKSNHSLPKKY